MSLGHAVSGSLGTAVSTFATYPLDLVNTRLKVQRRLRDDVDGPRYKSIGDAFRKIYAQEGGIRAFFAGLKTDLAKSALDSFLFFLFYNYLRAWLRARRRQQGIKKRSLTPLQELAVGSVAGAFSRLFTTPVANVVTRRQTAGAGALKAEVSFRESMAEIQREKGGVLGLWAGYSATLVLTLNPSITFFLQDALATAVSGDDLDDDAGPGFLLAAVSKVVATAITYPFQMAKAQVQVAPSPTEKDAEGVQDSGPGMGTGEKTRRVEEEPSPTARGNSLGKSLHNMATNNIFATVLKIAKADGVRALYDGIGGELLKAFFNHGITMLSKDIMHGFIMRLYLAVIILLKRHPEFRSRLVQTRRNIARQFQRGYLQVSSITGKAQQRLAGPVTSR